jgi:hypothetical protein
MRDHNTEKTILQLFFSSIVNLHTEMMGINIKSLFGSIYCKLIDECDYIDPEKKIELKTKLFTLVTTHRGIDESNKSELIIKFQRILVIIKCIIAKKKSILSVMSEKDTISKKLIASLHIIVNEMEQFLSIPITDHRYFMTDK